MNDFLEIMKDGISIAQPQTDGGSRNDKFLQPTPKVLKRSEKISQDYSPEYMQRKLPDSYKNSPVITG